MNCKPEEAIARIPGFEQGSQKVARSIHNKVVEHEGLRHVADVLHGVWLGHPLHPALTDFVIGAWVCGSILDGVSLTRRSKGIRQAADILISLGNAMAVPTALAGAADFSTVHRKAAPIAAMHAIMNAGGLVMNLFSSCCRSSGERETAVRLSAIASGTLMFSAWLGGRLTYDHKVGVNKIPEAHMKGEWRSAIKESDLQDHTPLHVDIDGEQVLLYRSGSETHAMGAVCAHEGGPLHKGKFQGSHVTCPWHQSVYDMKNGHVVHGPTTYPEPVYQVRHSEGNIEIKS